jgi:hypothetical protein
VQWQVASEVLFCVHVLSLLVFVPIPYTRRIERWLKNDDLEKIWKKEVVT